MGKKRTKSQTLPPSPSHSFSSASSSDFEFTISAVSPRKACPADELFYKGQLLPLHLSPRLSMVRTLLLASPSMSSSSDVATTASRDSTGSSNDSHSSFNSELVLFAESRDSSRRASSAVDEDEIKIKIKPGNNNKPSKYFSLSRFSSVFKRDVKTTKDSPPSPPPSSVKRMSVSAKEVIRKYVKKVKPLYERLQSQRHQQQAAPSPKPPETVSALSMKSGKAGRGAFSHSFSGNLRYPRRKGCVSSCPSSIRSSPSHSGVLCRRGFGPGKCVSSVGSGGGGGDSTTSSMEEFQSAIQGAIAHCKNSLLSQ